ncbi:hypothetical protein J4440_05800 [Candidatus Woesearchaeota archaeon]|nr:hypothetical protein [Candidatus Woesearchaeota archaeon]
MEQNYLFKNFRSAKIASYSLECLSILYLSYFIDKNVDFFSLRGWGIAGLGVSLYILGRTGNDLTDLICQSKIHKELSDKVTRADE